MIRLTSSAHAQSLGNRLPAVAVARMAAFEGTDGNYRPEEHGSIVVLEPGDTLGKVLPEITLEALKEGLSPFEYVVTIQEGGRRVFEAVVPLAGDACLVLIVPDGPGMDPQLREILEAQGMEE